MCDLCVMNAVKDRMISRRAFFTAGAAAVGGAALVSAGATTPAMAAGHDKVVDMTHAYDADFPTYFGEPGFAAEQKFNFKDNGFNLFQLSINEHTGTHIDAPLHFSADGASVDEIPVSDLVVPLCVVHIHERAASNPDAQVTPDDLKTAREKMFGRDNLYVAVVGAIDPEDLKRELDRVFGDLREKADLAPVADIQPNLGQETRLDYPVPQTTLRLAYPGMVRQNPEYFAAYLMNHMLGGGTFSSRLFEEVREKRGLVYGISSYIVNFDHATALMIGTGTAPDKAEETLAIIRDEVRRMAEEGPTEDELREAKDYVLGAYAINNLDSSSSIARTLVDIQVNDLGIDYIDRRVSLINSVTLDQVKAAAKLLLDAEPAVMIMGPQTTNGG